MKQEKIGPFIAEIRKQLGMTQKELAEKLGISDKTVSKWECGNSIPDISYLEEPYVAHDLVGVMADNKVSASDNDKVWAKHTKNKI